MDNPRARGSSPSNCPRRIQRISTSPLSAPSLLRVHRSSFDEYPSDEDDGDQPSSPASKLFDRRAECEPLIAPAGGSSSSTCYTTPRHRSPIQPESCNLLLPSARLFRTPTPQFGQSDDDPVAAFFLDNRIMAKLKNTRAAAWAEKLAVESEPGLTTAQLMLFNHDLKPVEPERRQWGPWNFVGFWVGMFATQLLSLSSSLINRVLTFTQLIHSTSTPG